MIIGDLVKINDVANDPRGSGVVLKFDIYTSERTSMSITKPYVQFPPREQIAEVLWADGSLGWILKSRLTTNTCDTYVQIHSP